MASVSTKLTAAALKREIAVLSDPVRAVFLQRFFRTGPGEYAEGDRLLGLTVPAQRIIARNFRDLSLPELAKLLRSRYHEHRLTALIILVDRHKRADTETKAQLHNFYLEHLDAVNNWDLVDSAAPTILGEHLRNNPALLKKLVKSANVWHRRNAIVGTFAELRAGRTALTFQIAEQLLGDRHDLIHKAVGWLLREAGKRAEPDLRLFLRTHYQRIPRTALRYAIERLAAADRSRWLSGPQ